MRAFTLKKMIVAGLFTVSAPCLAWFHLEPAIGYNKGQEQSSSAQGIGLGLRIGLDYQNFFFTQDMDYNDLQQGAQSSVKYTNTGFTIGGDFQRLRMWYGLITSAQLSYASNATTVSSRGSGTKFGMGIALGTNLNLNLEIKSLNYTSNDPGSGVTAAINEVGTFGFLSLSWVL